MAGGRPSLYTQATRDLICALLASGKSLRAVCAHPDLPAADTVIKWLADSSKKEFLLQYEAARRIQLELKADELEDLVIADPSAPDNAVAIARARLVVDTRKFVLAKLMPKKYGDFVEPRDDDANTAPDLSALSVEELAQWLALKRKMSGK